MMCSRRYHKAFVPFLSVTLYACVVTTLSLVSSQRQYADQLIAPSLDYVVGFDCTSLMRQLRNKTAATGKAQHLCKKVSVQQRESPRLTHLHAVRDLYVLGAEVALFLEGRNGFSVEALPHLSACLSTAPTGWEALQLQLTNNIIDRHGKHLHDLWISWFPDHFGFGIYVVNRHGMRKMLEASPHSDHLPVHERLFSVVTTYTLVDPTTPLVGDSCTVGPKICRSSEKILVFASVLISTEKDMDREIKWLEEDFACLSFHEPDAVWIVSIAVASKDLLVRANTRVTRLKKHAHLHFTVGLHAGHLNKFAVVVQFSNEMADYDYVLLKDSDQRLCGFPWKSFVSRAGDSVISAPLRQSVREHLSSEGMGSEGMGDIKQWFKLHDAKMWKSKEYVPIEYLDSTPLCVSFIEQYFVLMTGMFASWFFRLLPSEFYLQPSSWGVDVIWCGAARDFAGIRCPCMLVPLISLHEDQMSYKKSREVNLVGTKLLQKVSKYEMWANLSNTYRSLAGGKTSREVWERCTHCKVNNAMNLSHCLSTVSAQEAGTRA